jgi:hypothetical protein
MATTTLALAVVVTLGARHHANSADDFESANTGTLRAARVNGLIYAVVADSRGIYMTVDEACGDHQCERQNRCSKKVV